MNSIVFGKIKGRVQKSTTCSEDISPEEKNDILRQYKKKLLCKVIACGIILSSVKLEKGSAK